LTNVILTNVMSPTWGESDFVDGGFRRRRNPERDVARAGAGIVAVVGARLFQEFFFFQNFQNFQNFKFF
jgi:hypothetical protein